MDYATALQHLKTRLAQTPASHPVPLSHDEAAALATGPESTRTPIKTFTRGEHVTVYEGMGEFSLGIVTMFDADTGNVTVLLDGYIDLENIRHEPYEVEYTVANVNHDPDPAASHAADQKRMIPGYRTIPATL